MYAWEGQRMREGRLILMIRDKDQTLKTSSEGKHIVYHNRRSIQIRTEGICNLASSANWRIKYKDILTSGSG